MEAIKIQIEHQLHEICTITSSDFSALAKLQQRTQDIYWEYAFGNRNERYKHMVGKPGKGLAGSVIRLGTTMIVDQDSPGFEQLRLQSPIMLAENLQSAVAVPVQCKGKISGILLVGSRFRKKYSIEQINQIKTVAEKFGLFYDKEVSYPTNESH
ncbi:GAF domain-containing protein [Fredinandcohnia humi]